MTLNEVPDELQKLPNNDFIVVGLGNKMRGDDSSGVFIAENGLKDFPDKFINAETAIENHIFKITARPEKTIILVDAADFGGKPGDIKIIPLDNLKEMGISTHSLSLKRINIFLSAGERRVFFLGMKPKNCDFESAMTEEVKKSAQNLLSFFREKLSKCTN